MIGPNAAAPCYQGGTFAKIAVAPDTPTPIEAIRARYGAQTEITFEPGVDPQPRLPAMPMPMTVDYFGDDSCSGEPGFSEVRTTNSLVWFQGQHNQGRFDVPGSIRSTGHFVAEKAGTHKFYLGGTGTVRILVDGTELLAAGGVLEAKDVMGTLKRGDADMAELALEAGQEIAVTIEFAYTGARCQGLWYGIRSPDSPEAMLARAIEAARDADAVFLIVGETSDSSVESKDRADTKLAPEQIALIEAVSAANPRTAIIANVGHAFDTSWDDKAAALMLVWYPGQGFAPALASVLAGDREPGGRMPVSIARQEADYVGYSTTPDANGDLAYGEGTKFGYRGLIANGTPARHPFGSGIGYATFEWSDVAAEDSGLAVTLRNTSTRPGSEVIQLYRDTPETTLIGFTKVWLEPGEERRVIVRPEPKMMRIWEDGWKAIAGDVKLRVARDAAGSDLTFDLIVTTDKE